MTTKNIPVSTPGVLMVPVQLSGQYTATLAAISRMKLPFPAKLMAVSAAARASGGTAPTLTVDLQAGGVSVLSAPIDVTAGATAEGAIATDRLADEAELTIDLAIGGGTPTWDDITVLLTLVRI